MLKIVKKSYINNLKNEIKNIKNELDIIIEDKKNIVNSLKNDYKNSLKRCELLENDVLMLNEKKKELQKENEELRLGQKSLQDKLNEVEKNDNKNISKLYIEKSKNNKVKINKKI